MFRISGVILTPVPHFNRKLCGAPAGHHFKKAFDNVQNQGIPHTRPGIYKSSRRSRCARTRQRQPFLVSRELMTNFEMLTVKFCSICTSPWVLISSLCAIVFLHKFRRRPALPFPPGPKGLPILGNALDIPRVNPWLTYWQWGKKCSKYFPYSASVESAHYIFWNDRL